MDEWLQDGCKRAKEIAAFCNPSRKVQIYCRFDLITFTVLWVNNKHVDCYPKLEQNFLKGTKFAQEHKRSM